MRALWIAICMTLSTSLAAATMGEGLAAYQRGDYAAARTIVEPLASSGDAHAQYLLGRMHARGEGMLQDYVAAHQWLNLSAARGNRDARAERDRIARQMTPSQIAEAQGLARAWRPSQSASASAASSTPTRTATSRAPSPTRGPNTGNMVKDIQSMLSELGYDPGPADGVMGRRTRSAIRTYQLHSDLAVNGQPSQSLRKALATDLGYAPPESGSSTVASNSNSTSANTSNTTTRSAASNASSTAASPQSQAPVYVQEAQRSAAPARRHTSTPSGGTTSAAVTDLNALVQDGVQRRRADRRVLEALQDLVARYDQPAQRVIVEDSFADGNYTRNPAWQVVSGRFWIGRGEGLRSQVQAASSNQNSSGKQDIGRAVLGALLGQSANRPQNGPATIALPATIGPLFSVETELLSGQKPGEFSLGVYRGNNADTSLRLTYRPGRTPSLVLVRHGKGRVSTLASYDRPLNLEDGKAHYFVWTRDGEGRMRVSVDNRELLTTSRPRRRPPQNGFDGIFATNKGGNFGLRFVRIKSN